MSFTPVPYFHLSAWEVPTHGFFFLLAAAVCLALLSRRISAQDFRKLLNSIPWIVLGSLLGARAAYVLSRPAVWSDPISWLRFWEGGMVSYGGLVGCFVVLWVRHRNPEEPAFFDKLAGPCLLAWGIGRIGCLLNWFGEAGVVTNVPWAFVVEGVPRHPVTAYLALAYMLGGLLFLLAPHQRLPGSAGAAVVYYALVRGFVDQWRDYQPPYLKELSVMICGLLVLFGLILFRRAGRVPAASVETFD